jgi:hypothetical protein
MVCFELVDGVPSGHSVGRQCSSLDLKATNHKLVIDRLDSQQETFILRAGTVGFKHLGELVSAYAGFEPTRSLVTVMRAGPIWV